MCLFYCFLGCYDKGIEWNSRISFELGFLVLLLCVNYNVLDVRVGLDFRGYLVYF